MELFDRILSNERINDALPFADHDA
jgi:hypothetical protein